MSQTPCGCGRSPTGYCVGWHSLSDEDFDKKIDEYRTANPDLYKEDSTDTNEG